MRREARILEHLSTLITQAETILTSRKAIHGIGFDDVVDLEPAQQWVTQCQNILDRAFGKDSAHYERFMKCIEEDVTYHPVLKGVGVMKAAKADLEQGHLFRVRQLVEADVFDDMLEQAKHLLETGYYQAAVVVAGAVLEDTLRKLCQRNDLALVNRPKLDGMNAVLAKAGVYSMLTQKRVTSQAHS